MTIIEVKSDAHIKLFHQIPFGIYKTDPNWIPSIKQIRDVCEPDIEREDVTMEHVAALQNFLFDSIQATVDKLDEDKCITR